MTTPWWGLIPSKSHSCPTIVTHGVAKTSFLPEAVAPAVTITARHSYSVCAYSHMNRLILEFPGIVSLLYRVFGPLTPDIHLYTPH